MMEQVNINQYDKDVTCVYKTEKYKVRDNGAVFRLRRIESRVRPFDEKWTFGKPNYRTGYMEITSVSVHRIVATAFHEDPPTKEHVVDHIDTNKQNNRLENLRWVTRLENVLLNPITAKRIELVCGSVEAFLANPSIFRDEFPEPNVKWMCTVSKEEAQSSLQRLLAWAKSDNLTSRGAFSSRAFTDNGYVSSFQRAPNFNTSQNPNVVQKRWRTPCEFPCCPKEITDNPIQSYLANLKKGEVFSRNKYTYHTIVDYATSEDGNVLWVVCENNEDKPIKPWSLAQVNFEDNLFVHTNLDSFFEKTGAEKQFTLAQGLEWYGKDSIDDYS